MAFIVQKVPITHFDFNIDSYSNRNQNFVYTKHENGHWSVFLLVF